MAYIKIEKCSKTGLSSLGDRNSYSFEKYNKLYHLSSLASNSYQEEIQLFVFHPRHNEFLETFEKSWDIAFEENKKIHEENISKIEENRKTIQEIYDFMESKGIPKTYRTVDQKSRKTFKPTITVTSGYVQDISRIFDNNDGYENFVKNYESIKEKLVDVKKRCAALKVKVDRETEKKKKANKDFIDLIKLNQKYEFFKEEEMSIEDISDLSNELLYHIAGKNNILNLAYAMEQTRCDWNDGCDKVEYALFHPTNDLEIEIINDINEAIESFYDCQDGRVFRDCNWSYTELYKIVSNENTELFSDFLKVKNIKDNIL